MASSKRSRDLDDAANEALSEEAETSLLAVGREAVANLIALKESMEEKLNSNNQKLESMEEFISKELADLTEAITKQDKFQRICYAIENVGKYGSFDYQEFTAEDSDSKKLVYGSGIASSNLVLQILFKFQKGQNSLLPRGAVFASSASRSIFEVEKDVADKGEQAFRDSIVDQIFSLTGTKPDISKNWDGKYTISYF
jgi:hypothetical protein